MNTVAFWDPAGPAALSDLRSILRLAKRYSPTLGFLPNKAFTDRGRHKGLVLGRVNGELAGYALYDLPRAGHIKLVHVCVDDAARGSGLGRMLIDFVVELNPACHGVLAVCRRDYPLDKFWLSAGMVPKEEKPGRALKGSVLVNWWRPLGALDLFESAVVNSGMPLAVLDSNIVRDLYGPSEQRRDQREESQGLTAEWLEAAVNFAVSPHVDVELHNVPDPRERDVLRKGAAHLVRLRSSRPHEMNTESQLAELIGEPALNRDQSLNDDIKHLADAVNAGADYFVTGDANLLRVVRPWAKAKHGISVIRPHELVGQMQATLDRPSYESRLLESIELEWVPATAVDKAEVELAFIDYESKEKQRDFARTLRNRLADQPTTTTQVLVDEKGKAWALLSERILEGELRVPLLRVYRGARASTVSLQLARYLRRTAVGLGLQRITVTDHHLSGSAKVSLIEDGFFQEGNELTASVIADAMPVSDSIVQGLLDDGTEAIANVERRYWPLVVLASGIPSFIVPIQPRFAEHLFGYSNAAMFHTRKLGLGLSREHVYFYASGGTRIPDSPSRLLWYVTHDRTDSVRQLVARSTTVESRKLRPKDAHALYGHLGTLRLREIESVAGKDGFVYAVRFRDSEILEVPLGRPQLRPLFERFGVAGNIQSVRQVAPEMFDSIVQSQTESEEKE